MIYFGEFYNVLDLGFYVFNLMHFIITMHFNR